MWSVSAELPSAHVISPISRFCIDHVGIFGTAPDSASGRANQRAPRLSPPLHPPPPACFRQPPAACVIFVVQPLCPQLSRPRRLRCAFPITPSSLAGKLKHLLPTGGYQRSGPGEAVGRQCVPMRYPASQHQAGLAPEEMDEEGRGWSSIMARACQEFRYQGSGTCRTSLRRRLVDRLHPVDVDGAVCRQVLTRLCRIVLGK